MEPSGHGMAIRQLLKASKPVADREVEDVSGLSYHLAVEG
jgi:hypothetical protein